MRVRTLKEAIKKTKTIKGTMFYYNNLIIFHNGICLCVRLGKNKMKNYIGNNSLEETYPLFKNTILSIDNKNNLSDNKKVKIVGVSKRICVNTTKNVL